MHPLFIYLLKAAAVLLIFLGIYWLFFRNETFFRFLRVYLLTGILSAMVIPAINWVYYTEREYVPISMMKYSELRRAVTDVPVPNEPNWTLGTVLLITYLLGALMILLHRAHSILQIARLRARAERHQEQGLAIYQVGDPLPPFSFFNRIFWNPDLYSEEERTSILRHEEAHCRQWHSIDIMLMELCLIVLWWNPVSWAYRNVLRQNLEYLADRSASTEGMDRTSYQYAMLRLSAPEHAPMLANTFNKSFIKKRIVMLNQKPSHPKKIGFFALVLPLLAVFMYSFNRTEVVRYVPTEVIDPLMSSFNTAEKRIEIEMTAETSDAELDQIKAELAEDGIDLSYTTVRNSEGQITSLSIDVKGRYSSGKSFSGYYKIEEDGPIDPIFLFFDDEEESFSMSSGSLDIEDEIDIDVRVDEENEDVVVQNITVERDDSGKKKYRLHFQRKGEGGKYIITDSSNVVVRGYTSAQSPSAKSGVFVFKGNGKTKNGSAFTLRKGSNANVKIMTMPLDRKSIRKLKREARKARKNGDDGQNEYIIITGDPLGSMDFDFDMAVPGVVWNEMEEALHEGVSPERLGKQIEMENFVLKGQLEEEEIREMMEKHRIEWEQKVKENKEAIQKSIEETQKAAQEARKEAYEAQNEAREQQRKIRAERIVIREQESRAAEEARRAEREVARVVEREIYFTDGKDALYILDGEPSTQEEFEKLTPGDIEKVEVLKGNAAKALYGEKARDGVIIVTTRK